MTTVAVMLTPAIPRTLRIAPPRKLPPRKKKTKTSKQQDSHPTVDINHPDIQALLKKEKRRIMKKNKKKVEKEIEAQKEAIYNRGKQTGAKTQQRSRLRLQAERDAKRDAEMRKVSCIASQYQSKKKPITNRSFRYR
jgi:hypothetical protein